MEGSSKTSRSLGVRTRLVGLVVIVTSVVVISIAGYFIVSHTKQRDQSVKGRIALMENDLEKRGVALTRLLALASERAIAVMDYLFLSEAISTAVQGDDEILYGIIMDENRRALIHSDPAVAGQILDDMASKTAQEMPEPGTQRLVMDNAPIVEAMAPVYVGDERWGTIRFGLSEENVAREVQELEQRSSAQTQEAIQTILFAAVVLILFGSITGSLVAGKVLQPLGQLERAVRDLRQGNTSARATLQGSPEFVGLAQAFNEMAQAISERDTTLRSRAEQLASALDEATRASQAKSEFLANVSHELRTPLHAIVNVPKMLLRDYNSFDILECPFCNADYDPSASDEEARACTECGQGPLVRRQKLFITGEPEEHQDFLRRLREQADHLLHVVNDILDLSKLEAQRTALRVTRISTKRLFGEVNTTMESIAIEKQIALAFEQPESGVEFDGDLAQLRQVLINLVGNAMKFTPEGGEVRVIATQPDPSRVLFEVRDNGCGIPEDKQEIIFESFRQADSSHTPSQGGTGLGLTISRQIIALHEGKVWVESEVDVGSSFFIEIPTTRAASEDILEGES